jgi:hypothetical protein
MHFFRSELFQRDLIRKFSSASIVSIAVMVRPILLCGLY